MRQGLVQHDRMCRGRAIGLIKCTTANDRNSKQGEISRSHGSPSDDASDSLIGREFGLSLGVQRDIWHCAHRHSRRKRIAQCGGADARKFFDLSFDAFKECETLRCLRVLLLPQSEFRGDDVRDVDPQRFGLQVEQAAHEQQGTGQQDKSHPYLSHQQGLAQPGSPKACFRHHS